MGVRLGARGAVRAATAGDVLGSGRLGVPGAESSRPGPVAARERRVGKGWGA
ncbi:hypothetical protein [Streptomyces sp. NPDC093591]|uniref:hypothetical protein n=1 Tax=Streptomyces sp. NPDC093591 TaxID=3366044 RepID=UPI003812CA36